MSSISRRSLLGYSGTTAAGAVLGTAGTAQAVEAESSSADFPVNTQFSGSVNLSNPNPDVSEPDGHVNLSFRVNCDTSRAGTNIDPIEIADALNEYIQSRGWPPITFYGTPAPAPLN
ncbi:twin-arginine translocation signal domain-containing protein [Streptomyces beijiangensis]|uniref:Twin-arginine translocation signal domain-containing protein n=1 Tax=Streptomyces beijiangensis TaxID=163361 RepID=A0A939F9U5_9ACTN|nr:twin-arginine translocation signal domain-containing protein [Streptomyces beijiangensis]MBO0514178.1 twin-arginine translocation signal domain-containing protein [Streptomyces beijiangensis]